MMSNLDLWKSLETTDKNFTKSFKGKGGFSGTAINANYILRKLTETFGPCGKGWKFVLEEERTEKGHAIGDGVDFCVIHVVRGHIDYRHDGAWYSTGPQFGQTTFVGENKNGPFTDEEAPKKSLTDCLGKCAALLGVGADVYSGAFDDNKYVSSTDGDPLDIAPPKHIEPKTLVTSKATKAAIQFGQDAVTFLDECKNERDLFAWRKNNEAKIAALATYDKELETMVITHLRDAEARVLGT